MGDPRQAPTRNGRAFFQGRTDGLDVETDRFRPEPPYEPYKVQGAAKGETGTTGCGGGVDGWSATGVSAM